MNEIEKIENAIDHFAEGMKKRMIEKVGEGFEGWGSKEAVVEGDVEGRLIDKVLDLPYTKVGEDAKLCVDIANFAMMIHFNSEGSETTSEPEPFKRGDVVVNTKVILMFGLDDIPAGHAFELKEVFENGFASVVGLGDKLCPLDSIRHCTKEEWFRFKNRDIHVIESNPKKKTTVVVLKDGRVGKVVCQAGDVFNKDAGILFALNKARVAKSKKTPKFENGTEMTFPFGFPIGEVQHPKCGCDVSDDALDAMSYSTGILIKNKRDQTRKRIEDIVERGVLGVSRREIHPSSAFAVMVEDIFNLIS